MKFAIYFPTHALIDLFLQESTGKSSVPQIFFNEFHVGGNSDLQSIVEDELQWAELLRKLDEPFVPTNKFLKPETFSGKEGST